MYDHIEADDIVEAEIMNDYCDHCGCEFDEWELVEVETRDGETSLLCSECKEEFEIDNGIGAEE